MDKCARCGDDTRILVNRSRVDDVPFVGYCYPCRQEMDAEGTGEKFPNNFFWSMTDEELESLEDYLDEAKGSVS